uniref:Dynein light chain n=1 Tax=Rhizochromulina marina TaxID=1034831 RepID=A0A7S2SC93_9STRA|mmetsp:Transcript_28051/g.82151  ORF Transcript_28051/g.82151 Transcript_28051/m.82151 type:complete len:105 (+) Transcript_28051:208-522(+)
MAAKQEEKTVDEELSVRVIHKEANDEMHQFAVETAGAAYSSLVKGEKLHMKDLAEEVKKEFDAKYGGTWHVIVGKSFGSFVSHEVQCITYFFIGQVGFLIFKHG